jgi:hypothetical protein
VGILPTNAISGNRYIASRRVPHRRLGAEKRSMNIRINRRLMLTPPSNRG